MVVGIEPTSGSLALRTEAAAVNHHGRAIIQQSNGSSATVVRFGNRD